MAGGILTLAAVVGLVFGALDYVDDRHEAKGAPSVAEKVELLAGDIRLIKAERALESARRQLLDAEANLKKHPTAAARQDFEWAQDNYIEAKQRYQEALAK